MKWGLWTTLRAFPIVAALSLIALTIGACAEGSANYRLSEREKVDAAWLEQQPTVPMCRTDNRDLGYAEIIATKVFGRDESDGEHLGCPALLQTEVNGVSLADYNHAAVFTVLPWMVTTHRAEQWVHLHPEVKECVFERPPAEEGSLSYSRGSAITGFAFENPWTRTILSVNCDGHVISITNGVIPTGTPSCGQADIPKCAGGTP
jgi:hypothetical protein